MIGDTPLRIVVRSDPVTPIAAADQPLARRGFLGGTFGALLVAQPRHQHGHRFGLVSMLRAIVLAFGHKAGGQVGDPDGAVGLVHMLPTGATGSERIDAQLRRIELDLIRSVGFRQHRDRAGAGVGAALRFRRRNTLHPMPPRFEPQLAVDAVAFDPKHKLLVAAQITGRLRHDLGAPALPLAVTQVHSGQIGSKQRRLVAPGTRANFDECIARVVRVVGQQGQLQFALQPLDVIARVSNLFLRQLSQVGIGQHRFGRLQVMLARLEAGIQRRQQRRLGVFLA